MKYKRIYSELRILVIEQVHYTSRVDAFYPDYLAGDVLEDMPPLVRLAKQNIDSLTDKRWTALTELMTEAQVIREAIRMFDEAYPTSV